ncbi:hypothetical protein D3C81_1112910 [compost metagenome]
MKVDDVRFVEAVVGIDASGTVRQPGQEAVLQFAGLGNSFEQRLAVRELEQGA